MVPSISYKFQTSLSVLLGEHPALSDRLDYASEPEEEMVTSRSRAGSARSRPGSPNRIFVVVKSLAMEEATADVLLFESEADAYKAVLRIGSRESQQAQSMVDALGPKEKPMEILRGVALEDVKALSTAWEMPPWEARERSPSRAHSPRGCRSARGGPSSPSGKPRGKGPRGSKASELPAPSRLPPCWPKD